MNILKKINFKEKIELTKDFFKEYVLVKQSLIALGISLILSLLIIQITVPKFYVSATLREAQSSGATGIDIGGGADAILGNIVGAADSADKSYDEVISNLRSYIVAQRLWENGWGSEIFGNGQSDKEYFNNIPRKHKLTERLSAWLLGYQLYQFYSAHDLQTFIKDTIIMRKDNKQTNITISTLSSDKEFAIKFINAVILETDNYAKEYLIAKSNQIISASFEQLAVSKNSSITAAISNTINAEYFKIASLKNDMPYNVYFIDPPHSSEYPVTPNIGATFLSSMIIFLFLSISYSFIRKNKDELW
ncbi:hypothetical protein OAT62_06355 [Gammaproteobacteria bacterium]|nr:hypothetical protein [Gammaproteobacteria bacterium]MDC1148003.1 hypothetical protein [Gammaproteobacteria bacterium]